MKTRDVGVIVSTYNWPDALRACLRSLAGQTCSDFQVTVADDGSRDETRELVEQFAATAPFKVRHVWQDDDGFRLSAIRNRAAAVTNVPYLVFLDGDCIARPGFVTSHARLAERGYFLRGTRSMIEEPLTRTILDDRIDSHAWPFSRWRQASRDGEINRAAGLLRWPLGPLRKLGGGSYEGVFGCNMAAWREDIIKINGFDESYVGWGAEDRDFALRLLNIGVRKKQGRYGVTVLHFWHELVDRTEEPEERFERALRVNATRANLGIDQYL